MATLFTGEEITARFAPYIQELHELFALNHLHYGEVQDLPPLAEQIEKHGVVVDDVSSILRSIMLREQGAVPELELLEILAVAIAGPLIDPTTQEIQPGFRTLLTFVGGVVRRPWNEPPRKTAPPIVRETVPAERSIAQMADWSTSFRSNTMRESDVRVERPIVGATNPYSRLRATQTQEFVLPKKATIAEDPSSAHKWALVAAGGAIAIVLPGMLLLHSPSRGATPPALTATPVVTSAPITAPAPQPDAQPEATLPAKPSAYVPLQPNPAQTPRRGSHLQYFTPPPSSQQVATTAPLTAVPVTPQPSAPSVAAESPGATEDLSSSALANLPILPDGSRPFLVSSGVMESHLISARAPDYPFMARITHVQGKVVLQAVISPEGTVIATRVLSGHHVLRGAAASAVRHWHYRPYVEDGRAVNVATIITVNIMPHH